MQAHQSSWGSCLENLIILFRQKHAHMCISGCSRSRLRFLYFFRECQKLRPVGTNLEVQRPKITCPEQLRKKSLVGREMFQTRNKNDHTENEVVGVHGGSAGSGGSGSGERGSGSGGSGSGSRRGRRSRVVGAVGVVVVAGVVGVVELA